MKRIANVSQARAGGHRRQPLNQLNVQVFRWPEACHSG